MRIKINDKIYRLKEIESGADSLMELVEEPQYKEGDFVLNKRGDILIFKKKDENKIYDHAFFNNVLGLSIAQMSPSYSPIRRHATEEEKQILLDALAKEGKRWNAEKLCVEDIPAELKKGDLAIFWDSNKEEAFIGIYKQFLMGVIFQHKDHRGNLWANAIKFESKEQFEKLIKGEI